MQKIYEDIQNAINKLITFEELYIIITELDILDIHFHIHKLILKPIKYLINYPPNFSQLLCYYTIKPDIINKNIISFYTIQQKILLTYFVLKDNNYESLPNFFLKDFNILLLQKYINNFEPKIFNLLINKITLNEISLLLEKYDDNILEYLINNIDCSTFQKIILNLWDTKWLFVIKNLNIPENYISELKKNFKSSTYYNPAYLLLISNFFEDNHEDFFIKNFLQQKTQTKSTVCSFLSIKLIHKIFLHFNYINIDNYDFSWINFTEKNEEYIKNFLKQKSIKINKILSSYHPQVISKKYEFLKKNIKIFTAISNLISNEKIFLIKESNLNKLFQAGTISYFDKNQYT